MLGWYWAFNITTPINSKQNKDNVRLQTKKNHSFLLIFSWEDSWTHSWCSLSLLFRSFLSDFHLLGVLRSLNIADLHRLSDLKSLADRRHTVPHHIKGYYSLWLGFHPLHHQIPTWEWVLACLLRAITSLKFYSGLLSNHFAHFLGVLPLMNSRGLKEWDG